MSYKSEDFVNVCVRVKPVIKQDPITSCLEIINTLPPVILLPDKSLTYHFDKIFTDENKQKDVYNETVKPLVENVKAGYNCTVFAYGQTGTGKTYTMGTDPDIICEEECGLISRTIEDLFYPKNQDEEIEIFISFIEIYNEKAFDLLTDRNKAPLSINGFTVHGSQKVKVYNTQGALSLLKAGGKNRHTGETKQNSKSSRSHAVFTIHCCTRNSEKEVMAKLNLVDLAGSESARKTGNQGSSFHEGININKGLLSLGQVMRALSANSVHVPYRRSVITTILQDSLNKKNFVTLIACVSSNSEDLGETLRTLDFSHRVKKMKNKPEVNEFILQYKKDETARGLTPLKRSNGNSYETPFKKPNNFLPVIQEPSNSINSSNLESSQSLFSVSSMSSARCEVEQNLSPVIRKYMNAMEYSIMNKIEDMIKNTLKRPRRTSSHKENKENPSTPSFSWEKVSQVVRSELLQFTTQAPRATSSPSEGKVFSETSNLNVEGNPLFLKARKLLTYDSDTSITLADNKTHSEVDDVFKVPAPKNAKSTKSPFKRRSNMRLQMKSHESELQKENTHIRRSIRLQCKKNITNCNVNDTTIAVKRKRKLIETFIESDLTCFNVESPKITSLKNVKANLKVSPITYRTKQVLNILNNGSLREIEKLHTIGSKTAEKIQFFRQLKGNFKSISDLSDMPYWTKNKYHKFLAENFLRDEELTLMEFVET